MLAGDSFPRNPLTTTRLVVLAAFVSYPLFLGIRRVSRRTRDPPPLGLVDIFPSEEECEKLNEAGLDIIAVHGLGAHSEKTWTRRAPRTQRSLAETLKGFFTSNHDTRIEWLREFLPESFPTSHIMIFGYHANWLMTSPLKTTRKSAKFLLDEIKDKRAKTKICRPILFIAHSFGGIVVKEALTLAKIWDEYQDVADATIGVLFLGTPHKGSNISWLGAKASAVLAPFLGSSDMLIKSLGYHSDDLADKHGDFLEAYKSLNIYCFYETLPTWMLGLPLGMVVDQTSATIDGSTANIDLDLDHSDLNKFRDRKDKSYIKVRDIVAKIDGAAVKSAYVRHRKSHAMVEETFRQCQVRQASSKESLEALAKLSKTNASPQAQWFLESKEYNDWLSHSGERPSQQGFLWYTGRRDASKTEAITVVVRNLSASAMLDILYFFGSKPKKAGPRLTYSQTTATEVLRSIISQLVSRDKSRISDLEDEDQERLSSIMNPVLEISHVQHWNLLGRLLRQPRGRRILIIIDSLESIQPEDDRLRFVQQLRNLWDSLILDQSTKVQILVSSLPFDPIRKTFAHLPTVDPIVDVIACLDSLKSVAPNFRQKDNKIKGAHVGTGDWIVSDPTYEEWRDKNLSQAIWLLGRAGSGKSTLLWKLLVLTQDLYKVPSLQDLMDDPQSFGRNWQRESQASHYYDDDDIHQVAEEATSVASKTIVTSFFYSQKMKSDTSHVRMLGSVLFQILCQEVRLIDLFRKQYLLVQSRAAKAPGSGKDTSTHVGWTYDELKEVLLAIKNFSLFPLTIFIFVDGIDESEDSATQSEDSTAKSEALATRTEVLNILTSAPSSPDSSTIIKLMFASRRISQKPNMDMLHHEFALDDKNGPDITRFLDDRLEVIREHIAKFDLETRKRYNIEQFRENLVKNAKGVFLWVSLVLQLVTNSLEDALSIPDYMMTILETPPDKLEDLYKKIVVRLSQKHDPEKIKLGGLWMELVAFAEKFLDVKEFIDAVAISALLDKPNDITDAKLRGRRISVVETDNLESFRNMLSTVCGGFLDLNIMREISTTNPRLKIEVEDVSQAKTSVQLLHWTVKVFLQKDEAKPFKASLESASRRMALACLSYLKLTFVPKQNSGGPNPLEVTSWTLAEFKTFTKDLEDRPFLSYSLLCLRSHLEEWAHPDADDAVKALIDTLQESAMDSTAPARYFLSCWLEHIQRPQAASQNISSLSDPLRSWRDEMNATMSQDQKQFTSKFLGSALVAAAEMGYLHALKALCAAGAAAGVATGDENFALAIEKATEAGFIDIVELLALQRGNLWPAAKHGQQDDKDSRPDQTSSPRRDYREAPDVQPSRNDRLGTILLSAVNEGNTRLVERVLEDGAPVDYRDEMKRSAIHLAAAGGQDAIVEVLVNAGVDPDSRDSHGYTPLTIAAMNGYEAIVRRLLLSRVDPNSLDENSWTPLQHAVENEHEAVVRQLLAFGGDDDTRKNRLTKAGQSLFMVPFPRNPDFMGRVRELDLLHQSFRVPSIQFAELKRVSIVGLGGIGKSQLAAEFAYQVKDRDPTVSVFWATARSAASFAQDMLLIARRLELHGMTDGNSDAARSVKLHLESRHIGRWIMVLDDANDEDELFGTPSSQNLPIIRYIPNTREGFVLVTSRNKRIASRVCQKVIEVHPMDEEYGIEMLKRLIKTGRQAQFTTASAQRLAAALDFVPLAIYQAAAFINQNSISVDQYYHALQKGNATQRELLSTEFADSRRSLGTSNSISTTWHLSFERILREDRYAADLLALMSVLYADDVPIEILQIGSITETRQALRILENYSLVKTDGNGESYTMHRLVQMSAKSWLSDQNTLSKWEQVALQQVALVFPRVDFPDWEYCDRLLPHADAVLARALPENPNYARLSQRVGTYLVAIGRYRQATDFMRRVAMSMSRAHGGEHSGALEASSLLALAMHLQGQFEESGQLQRRVMEVLLRDLGIEDAITLTSMHRLGTWLLDQGCLIEAKDLLQLAMFRRRQVLGEEHPDTLSTQDSIGLLYLGQNKVAEAASMMKRVLVVRERSQGREHPDTLTTMSIFASVLLAQGLPMKAQELGLRVYETRSKVLGSRHPLTLESFSDLGWFFMSIDQASKAMAVLDEAMELQLQVLGPEHPARWKTLERYAECLLHQNDLEEARSCYERASTGFYKTLGKSHPSTIRTKKQLDMLKEKLGVVLDVELEEGGDEEQHDENEEEQGDIGGS